MNGLLDDWTLENLTEIDLRKIKIRYGVDLSDAIGFFSDMFIQLDDKIESINSRIEDIQTQIDDLTS